MLRVLAFLIILACIHGYKVPRIVVPLDSSIQVLRWSDSASPVASSRDSSSSVTGTLPKDPHEVRHKKVVISWDRDKLGKANPLLFPLELPNTVIIKNISNLVSFPVLSIDYGSRFIGLSLHHMGRDEVLKGVLNSGNVEETCSAIYTVVKELIRPPTRFILLVGLPFSRGQVTEGKCLFQTLYNLDFATRLSRYIHRRHLEVYGNWEHILKDKSPTTGDGEVDKRCISCTLELGCCPYNCECAETFVLQPSDYGSATVLGISEEFSSYQTEIFSGNDRARKDSLSSDLIFRSMIEALRSRQISQLPFLVLPSNNNIFRSHAKGDCMLFYKGLCSKILASMK